MNPARTRTAITRLVVAILLADLSTKVFASVAFANAKTGAVVPVSNPDFSLGVPGPPLASMLAAMATGIIVAGYFTVRAACAGRLPAWVPAALIGGSLANLLDRAVSGAVHDFLATPWIVLNVADLAVAAGVVGMVATCRGSELALHAERAPGPPAFATGSGLPIRADRIPPYDERMDRAGPRRRLEALRELVTRLSRLERVLAVAAGVVFVGLVVAEPSIVVAPFESTRAVGAVVGGAVLAATALLVMLHFRVRPVIRARCARGPPGRRVVVADRSALHRHGGQRRLPCLDRGGTQVRGNRTGSGCTGPAKIGADVARLRHASRVSRAITGPATPGSFVLSTDRRCCGSSTSTSTTDRTSSSTSFPARTAGLPRVHRTTSAPSAATWAIRRTRSWPRSRSPPVSGPCWCGARHSASSSSRRP